MNHKNFLIAFAVLFSLNFSLSAPSPIAAAPPPPTPGGGACPPGSKPFKVMYSGWDRVTGHPDFEAAGLVRMPGIYEGSFWKKGAKLNENRLRDTLRRHAAEIKATGLFMVDIEGHPVNLGVGDNANVVANRATHLRIAEIVREEAPGVKFGWYGVATPCANCNHAAIFRGLTPAELALYMRDNDARESSIQVADFVLPQMYTLDDNQAKWAAAAKFHLQETRRIAPGKPAYVFLKENYNIHDPRFKFDPIPYDYIKFQLEELLRLGYDGAVFWQGKVKPWGAGKEDIWFWPAVLDFMKENKLCTGGGPTTDTTPPSAPTNLTATTPSPFSIKLTWKASTDDRPGLITYEIYRDGKLIDTTTSTTYLDLPVA